MSSSGDSASKKPAVVTLLSPSEILRLCAAQFTNGGVPYCVEDECAHTLCFCSPPATTARYGTIEAYFRVQQQVFSTTSPSIEQSVCRVLCLTPWTVCLVHVPSDGPLMPSLRDWLKKTEAAGDENTPRMVMPLAAAVQWLKGSSASSLLPIFPAMSAMPPEARRQWLRALRVTNEIPEKSEEEPLIVGHLPTVKHTASGGAILDAAAAPSRTEMVAASVRAASAQLLRQPSMRNSTSRRHILKLDDASIDAVDENPNPILYDSSTSIVPPSLLRPHGSKSKSRAASATSVDEMRPSSSAVGAQIPSAAVGAQISSAAIGAQMSSAAGAPPLPSPALFIPSAGAAPIPVAPRPRTQLASSQKCQNLIMLAERVFQFHTILSNLVLSEHAFIIPNVPSIPLLCCQRAPTAVTADHLAHTHVSFVESHRFRARVSKKSESWLKAQQDGCSDDATTTKGLLVAVCHVCASLEPEYGSRYAEFAGWSVEHMPKRRVWKRRILVTGIRLKDVTHFIVELAGGRRNHCLTSPFSDFGRPAISFSTAYSSSVSASHSVCKENPEFGDTTHEHLLPHGWYGRLLPAEEFVVPEDQPLETFLFSAFSKVSLSLPQDLSPSELRVGDRVRILWPDRRWYEGTLVGVTSINATSASSALSSPKEEDEEERETESTTAAVVPSKKTKHIPRSSTLIVEYGDGIKTSHRVLHRLLATMFQPLASSAPVSRLTTERLQQQPIEQKLVVQEWCAGSPCPELQVIATKIACSARSHIINTLEDYAVSIRRFQVVLQRACPSLPECVALQGCEHSICLFVPPAPVNSEAAYAPCAILRSRSEYLVCFPCDGLTCLCMVCSCGGHGCALPRTVPMDTALAWCQRAMLNGSFSCSSDVPALNDDDDPM